MGYIPVASYCARYGVAAAARRRFGNRPRAPGSLRGDARHPHRVLLRSASRVVASRGALLQPLDPPHRAVGSCVLYVIDGRGSRGFDGGSGGGEGGGASRSCSHGGVQRGLSSKAVDSTSVAS